jgi:hypothetical protein
MGLIMVWFLDMEHEDVFIQITNYDLYIIKHNHYNYINLVHINSSDMS